MKRIFAIIGGLLTGAIRLALVAPSTALSGNILPFFLLVFCRLILHSIKYNNCLTGMFG